MSIYGFKVRRKEFEISVSSNSEKLIKEEYQKFMAEFLGLNLADVLREEKIKKAVSAIPSTKKEVVKKVETPVVADVETGKAKKTKAKRVVKDTTKTTIKAKSVEKKKEKTTLKTNNKTAVKKTTSKLPANFANLLAEKTASATNNVVEKKTSELKNTYVQMQSIIKEKELKSEIDYIVASAYCLTHYENLMQFPEAQIRAKIAPFFKKKLDHNFILDAVAKNYIRVLPDFTGVSDEIEYELTQQGEEYFLNEL